MLLGEDKGGREAVAPQTEVIALEDVYGQDSIDRLRLEVQQHFDKDRPKVLEIRRFLFRCLGQVHVALSTPRGIGEGGPNVYQCTADEILAAAKDVVKGQSVGGLRSPDQQGFLPPRIR